MLDEISVVAAMYDGLAAGDLANITQHLSQDARIIAANGLPYSGTYVGPAGLGEVLNLIFASTVMRVENRRIVQAGDRVMATMDCIFTSNASGRSVTTPIVELFTVTDGIVTELDIYYKDPSIVANLFARG